MTPISKVNLLIVLFLIQGPGSRSQSPVPGSSIPGTPVFGTPVFGIYFATGNIRYSPARGGGIRPLAPHTWLHSGDKLTLVDNIAEITLLARDSSYIRLQGKGSYTMAQLDKMPRTQIRDTIMIQYFSLFWEDAIHAAPVPTAAHPPAGAAAHPPAGTTARHLTVIVHASHPSTSASLYSLILAPRPGYVTSLDSIIFRWRDISWARKYFLRLRNPEGELCFDSILTDTQAVVHFPNRMPVGNSYAWALDIVAESGRLQFADSGHIVLIKELDVIAHLPAVPADSIGGIAPILERIEQYENAGCIKEAEAIFFRLTNDFPEDNTLDKLYLAFRRRNYF